MNGLFNSDGFIRFVSETHEYFDPNGRNYRSVTQLIKSVVAPFDKQRISMAMAGSIARDTGVSVDQAHKELLDSWEAKKNSSIDRGNWIHNALEQYLLTGKIEDALKPVAQQLQPILKDAYRFYTEVLTYSESHGIAGQSDLIVQRQKGGASPVFDFYDYKTNESKGIEFDSISRKNGDLKHYNRFMLHPFEHLEDCNFHHYSLQLSLYAYMSMITWGIRVGKLGILYIDNELTLHYYPVPFLYYEAKTLLLHYKQLKPLPEVKKKEEEEFDW